MLLSFAAALLSLRLAGLLRTVAASRLGGRGALSFAAAAGTTAWGAATAGSARLLPHPAPCRRRLPAPLRVGHCSFACRSAAPLGLVYTGL